MSVLDVLVTEYNLVDNYSQRAENIARSTESLGQKIEGCLAAGTRLSYLFATTLVGGLVALGGEAIKAYGDMQQLETTLESLTGSAEKAAQKLDFIRRLAVPAPIPFSDLARAGVELEAFGLRVERVLPSVAKIASAFKGNPAALQEAVRIFGEFASGANPNIRQMTALGISRKGLESEGVRFDPQGKLLSSAKEALEGLDRYIQTKYGDILDKLAGQTNSKLASLRDRWERLLIRVGEALTRYALPVMDKLLAFLDKLEKNKGFDNFLKNLGKNLVKFILAVAQGLMFLELALAAIRFAMKDFVGAFLSTVAAVAITAGSNVFGKKATDFLNGIGKMNPDGTKADVPKDPHPELGYTGDDDALSTQKDIEENTAKIATNTSFLNDLKRYVVGGGPLGSIGITPVELRRGSHNSRPLQVNVNAGTKRLSDAIEEMIIDTVGQIERQGNFFPTGH